LTTFKLKLQYLEKSNPRFANLGDILKSIQTVFNTIANIEDIKGRQPLRILSIKGKNPFFVEVVANLEEDIIIKLFNKLRELWKAFQIQKEDGVLRALGISKAMLSRHNIDAERIGAYEIEDLSEEVLDDLENKDPFFTIKMKTVTHIRRAHSWDISTDTQRTR
jgi:hypothetical protein